MAPASNWKTPREETLKAAEEGEIIPLILGFRGAEKLAQQAASLLECVKQDGRILGRLDPTGTATDRVSSKYPNLQNIGRGELRSCFIPCPGHRLIVADLLADRVACGCRDRWRNEDDRGLQERRGPA